MGVMKLFSSSQASTALESPTLAQNILFPTIKTLTQVDPLKYKSIPEFCYRAIQVYSKALVNASFTSVESTTL